MKTIIVSYKNLFLGILILIVLLGVTQSCKKSSDTPGRLEVYIENMAFTPSTITVPVNSAVIWINKDGMIHTVTSTLGLFDSGSIANNGTYSYTFPVAGSYTYKCSVHPSMVGTVIVTSDQTGGGSGY